MNTVDYFLSRPKIINILIPELLELKCFCITFVEPLSICGFGLFWLYKSCSRVGAIKPEKLTWWYANKN